MNCLACHDKGYLDLPVDRGMEEFPCPCCKAWAGGFPGERIGDRWVIEPSKPGELAKYKPRNTHTQG